MNIKNFFLAVLVLGSLAVAHESRADHNPSYAARIKQGALVGLPLFVTMIAPRLVNNFAGNAKIATKVIEAGSFFVMVLAVKNGSDILSQAVGAFIGITSGIFFGR